MEKNVIDKVVTQSGDAVFNYETLANKPTINGEEMLGDMRFECKALTEEQLRSVTKEATKEASIEAIKEAIEEVDKNRKDLIGVLDGSIENLENEEITKIGDYAFYKNKNIKSVNCPNLKEVGLNAFMSCKNFSEINLDAVETLWEGAFNINYDTPFNGKEIVLPNIKDFKYDDSLGVYSSHNPFFFKPSKISMPNLKILKDVIGRANLVSQYVNDNGEYIFKELNLENLVTIDNSNLFVVSIQSTYGDWKINVPNLEEIINVGKTKIGLNNYEAAIGGTRHIEFPKLKRIQGVTGSAFSSIGYTNTPLESFEFPELSDISYGMSLYGLYCKEIRLPKLTSKLGNDFFVSNVTKIYAPLVTGFVEGSNISGERYTSPVLNCTNLEEADFSGVTSIEGSGTFNRCIKLKKLILNSLETWKGSYLSINKNVSKKPITLILNKCKSVEMGAYQPKYEVIDLGNVETINGAGYSNDGIGDLIIRTDKVCELSRAFSSGSSSYSPEHIYVPKKYLTSDGYLDENSLWYTYKDNFVALEGSKYEDVNWYKN